MSPLDVELLRCTATAPRLHIHILTLCVVCASHFMEEALVVLILASRAGFNTVVSEPSCV